MISEINEIKEVRKKLGITQSELAKKADVSQSLIAKIESGNIDPTYTKARQLFKALEKEAEIKEVKASDIMQKRVIKLKPSDNIKSAIRKMKKYEISQMPVISNNRILGIISESVLMNGLLEGKHSSLVKDMMKDSPPIVGKNTPFRLVSSLLKYYPMVIVSEKGKILGVITKSDIIRKLYK